MVICDVCGGDDFVKHGGFMYCAVCQTQSQDYHEQEYDYQNHTLNTSRRQKSADTARKTKVKEVCEDGFWTTWEAFNYILHGMVEEIKNCGAGEEVGKMVFMLWAAYLRENEAAFTSKYQEKIPKLGFCFKNRDAKILYNVNLRSSNVSRRSFRSRSCSSRVSNTSNSSIQSKRSINLQKEKIIAAEYEDYIQSSGQRSLDNETLKSLKMSSDETSEELTEDEDQLKSLKYMLDQKDYKLYKNLHNSKRRLRSAKNRVEVSVRCLGKNKLLSLIHLALLMTGSEIQLSDLLRFIRESHLSFAKVTHFFPKAVRLPKKDFTYLETVTDHIMPTHLAQRKILGKLARFLRVKEIPTPDIASLIDRYCMDLNLPKQIAEFSKKITIDYLPRSTVPGGTMFAPNYEGWAMASIIIAMKLLLGLNGRTEIFLSCLAREINNSGKSQDSLFVFQDWQKFIECRKTVLTNFHYPTEEQLGGNSSQSCKNFFSVLMKESKDEHRNARFIRYPKYYIHEEFLNGVKEMLNGLSKPQDIAGFNFKPSLTPQVSNLETIMRDLSQITNADGGDSRTSVIELPEKILQQDFKNCDLKFALDPKGYLNLLDKDCELFTKFRINKGSLQKKEENLDFLLNCTSRYWIFRFPEKSFYNLDQFNNQVLRKTPENFQWLIKECSRMVEMNVRNLYEEVLRFELLLIAEPSRKS